MKNTHSLLSLLILLVCHIDVSSQIHLQVLNENPQLSYAEVVRETSTRISQLPGSDQPRHWKQFYRWQRITSSRLTEDDQMFNYAAMNQTEFERSAIIHSPHSQRSHTAHWTNITPNEIDVPHPNNGRCNVIAIHPSDPNTIFVGTALGGLWKTTNGGTSWTCLTDGMPNLGISGIAIDHTNPNRIFILTGDGDGKYVPSIGILKSLDGGLSWQSTSLKWNRDQNIYGYKLLMNLFNPQEMWIATSVGIRGTWNGWDHISSSLHGINVFDIEYKPGSQDTLFACSQAAIFRSVEGGTGWNSLSIQMVGLPSNPQTDRIALAVTPANPNKVYALYADQVTGNGYYGLYMSDNSGASWTKYTDTFNIVGAGTYNQVGWDLTLAVDPANASRVYVGGMFMFKSDNQGQSGTWTNIMNGGDGLHSDLHDIVFRGSTMYAANDGGICKSTNGGATWTNISNGLNILQPYDLDVRGNEIIIGTQDNGTIYWEIGDPVGIRTSSSDGFECLFDPGDPMIHYATTQYIRARSDDNGGSYDNIHPPGYPATWDASWLMHPAHHDTLYTGGPNNISRTYDRGETWSDATITGFAGDLVRAMAQGVNNTNVMYVSNRDQLARTSNVHATTPTWTGLTHFVPHQTDSMFTTELGGIAVDPVNTLNVWITFLGYSSGNKVFKSTTGGFSWTNISGSLPNVPVTCVAYEPGSAHGLYIGTDIGIFYRNDTLNDWLFWSNGLPTTRIEDLKVYNGFLYAATFGRGVWRSTLFLNCPDHHVLTQANDPSNPNSSGHQEYFANQSISSSRIITGGIGSDVYYTAGNYISLTPGFWGKIGNYAEMKIGGCPD